MYLINGICDMGADIVSAVIDNTGIELIPERTFLTMGSNRDILLQPHPIEYDVSELVNRLGKEGAYKSYSTYLTRRRIDPNRTMNHTYIFVDPSSEEAIKWVRERLITLGSLPDDFSEKMIKNGSVIGRYYADLVIPLDDVLNGNLIETLSKVIDTPLDSKLYESWLTLTTYDVPWGN